MPPSRVTPISGALLTAVWPGGVRRVTVNGVLKPGSSKLGKTPRPSIDSSWVQAYHWSATLTLNSPAGALWNGAL